MPAMLSPDVSLDSSRGPFSFTLIDPGDASRSLLGPLNGLQFSGFCSESTCADSVRNGLMGVECESRVGIGPGEAEDEEISRWSDSLADMVDRPRHLQKRLLMLLPLLFRCMLAIVDRSAQ